MYPAVSLFINGTRTAVAAGRAIAVVNPATGEVIGSVAHADKSDLGRALEAAETNSVSTIAAPVKNIVLVHGAWVNGSGWKPVFEILARDGHRASVAEQPLTPFSKGNPERFICASALRSPPVRDDDVATARSCRNALNAQRLGAEAGGPAYEALIGTSRERQYSPAADMAKLIDALSTRAARFSSLTPTL
jgi:hypothetical protein